MSKILQTVLSQFYGVILRNSGDGILSNEVEDVESAKMPESAQAYDCDPDHIHLQLTGQNNNKMDPLDKMPPEMPPPMTDSEYKRQSRQAGALKWRNILWNYTQATTFHGLVHVTSTQPFMVRR